MTESKAEYTPQTLSAELPAHQFPGDYKKLHITSGNGSTAE